MPSNPMCAQSVYGTIRDKGRKNKIGLHRKHVPAPYPIPTWRFFRVCFEKFRASTKIFRQIAPEIYGYLGYKITAAASKTKYIFDIKCKFLFTIDPGIFRWCELPGRQKYPIFHRTDAKVNHIFGRVFIITGLVVVTN